ncbi:MAG: hypothetical protein HY267_08015 [Deltaproteobacteria bacterium]|nr:hypothetical protein [Deltaproteobacteria bacterium]
MAAANRKKTPKRRRWILPKLFMLLGIVVLSGILVVIFIMEQELNRIGFFGKSKRLPLQPPQVLQKDAPVSPPSLSGPPSTSAPAPASDEGISAEDRKRLEGLTSSRSPEKLSQDDRKRLEDILRSR